MVAITNWNSLISFYSIPQNYPTCQLAFSIPTNKGYPLPIHNYNYNYNCNYN